ncbi:hypothetical protein LTS15_000438 [Exophiala xenobiotica]|nr:hypothetical protein LTS15_000438 [Exophiala xenobiotica]
MCSCVIIITRVICESCAEHDEITLVKGNFFRDNPERAVSLSKRCYDHHMLALPRKKQYRNKLGHYSGCPSCRQRKSGTPSERPVQAAGGSSRPEASPAQNRYGSGQQEVIAQSTPGPGRTVPGKSVSESQRRREYVTQNQHGGRQPQPHPQPKAQALEEQGMFLEEKDYPVRRARFAVNQEVKLSGEGQPRPQTSPDQGRGAKQQKKKPKLAKVLKWLTS